jgi:ribosomal protein S18 acetylase RimI-like enzyme
MTYTWRALTVADAPRWAAFTKIVSDADDADEVYSAEDLAEELEDLGLDLEHDTMAVEDGDTLVAVGQAGPLMLRPDGTVRADFAGAVHPDHRGRGLGTELLGRLQRRCAERAKVEFAGAPVQIRTAIGAPVAAARTLLEAHGYGVARYFHTLTRGLSDVAPFDDARVHPYDVARDPEVHAAHCEAFSTHWGFAPPDADMWRTWLTGSRTFRPANSVVGLGPDGVIEGYGLCYQYQPDELVIGQLGVLPAARGQGLARAMLQRILAVAAPTYVVAKLDVDSENADGAGRLYESAGFVRQRSNAIYIQS